MKNTFKIVYILLIILKILNVIHISWWILLLPYIVGFGLIAIFLILVLWLILFG